MGSILRLVRTRSIVFKALTMALLFCCSVAGVRAQSSGGTIAGTVYDPSGALVAGATISAVGADTGTTYNAVSTSAGVFRFPQMQLGRYNLTIAAPGFSNLKLDGIQVTTGNVSPADAHMTTGGGSETVTVNDSAPVVETENAEVSNTVSSRQVIDLPLSLGGQSAMRSVEAFIFLAPGTVGPGTSGSTSGAFQAKTAGGQNFGTEELLDGISVRRADSNAAFDEHAPGVEALVELKVTTSIIPATEGRTTGGVNNFTTHGGTNQYHGTAYDIFQNEDLNANSYFNKLFLSQGGDPASFQRPADKENDYGGAIGGPLSIPHIYNGHDRTFGFFSWEQFRQSQSGVAISTIPNAAVRSGDFSGQLTAAIDGPLDEKKNVIPGFYLDCTGKQVFVGELMDPATTSTIFNPTQGKVVPCRNPFPGNRIDPTRFSKVGQNILKFLPAPNNGSQNLNNYSYSSSFPKLNTVYSIRVDHSLSDKSKVFVTYTDRDNNIRNGLPPYPGPGGGVQFQHSFTKYLRAGSDYTVSPTSFNHFVAGFTRLQQLNFAGSLGYTGDFSQLLGIGGVSGSVFPAISFASTFNPQYNSIGYNNNSVQPVNAFEVSDTYSFIRGRHTLAVGLDYRKDQFSNTDKGANGGSFSFSPFQTAAGPNDNQSGDGFASLLLGQVNQASLTVQSRAPRFVQNYYAAYAQDEFKLTHNLLLELGVRYDIDQPRGESHGNLSNFDPTLPNAAAGGLPGALVFAGNGPGRIGGTGKFANTWKKNVAPRIGFAYTPDSSKGTTSIRGGFGIYYGPIDYGDFGSASQLGFSATPNFQNQDGFTQAVCNGATTQGTTANCGNVAGLDQGVPAYAAPPNLDPTQNTGQNLGGQVTPGAQYIAPSYGRSSATYNWGLQVQQQLATDLIMTLGYIGTSSSHLHSDLAQINDLNPKYFGLGSALTQSLAPGAALPYPGFGGTLAQSLRPFPQYQDINTSSGLENLGHSTYQALTGKLERRFHSGLNLLAAYTWSKTLTDADSNLPAFSAFEAGQGSIQNPYNLKSEKALSFQDTPHNFVVSYIYELPVGKGKKFLNQNAVVNAVVGGFQVGGINRYLSGQPVSFGCTNQGNGPSPTSGTAACLRYNIGPNFIDKSPGANSGNPLTRHIFNKAAFTSPSTATAFALGTSPRVNGAFRTPIYKNEDFSIVKHLADFGEYGNLQLHVDIFNAFNRTHFNAPDTNPADGSFGTIQGAFGLPTQRQFILRYAF